MNKLDMDYIENTHAHTLAFHASEESIAGILINNHDKPAMIRDLSIAEVTSNSSSSIAFRSRTAKVLKDSPTDTYCDKEIIIPRWRAVTKVDKAVRALGHSC